METDISVVIWGGARGRLEGAEGIGGINKMKGKK